VFTLFSEVRGSRYHDPAYPLNMALAGFIAGLIIPHKNGFAISLTEKLEDFVILLLIPIVRPPHLIIQFDGYLRFLPVLRSFRAEDRLESIGQRGHMGIRYSPLRRCVRW